MGSENSSDETRNCANGLAANINSNHCGILIDSVITSLLGVFQFAYGFVPSFRSTDNREIMALQNIQARTRMVLAYLFAQLALVREKRPGGLLVLGTANVDESLVGYLTKYDCSSADINPIGSVSKIDLRNFLQMAHDKYGMTALKSVIESTPTAELRPLVDGKVAQTDEDEIGLTYEELSVIGRLRKPGGMGPYAMFLKLLQIWSHKYTVEQIEEKVRKFWWRYRVNRHKATVSTPAVHAEVYSPDDHRNDHRPFLYPDFSYQFERIREKVEEIRRNPQRSEISRNVNSTQLGSLLTVEKTQEEKTYEGNGRFEFFSDCSKRVRYRRSSENDAFLIVKDVDKTIRSEHRFLDKIERTRGNRLQQVCLCPLTRFYKVSDFLSIVQNFLRRIGHVFYVACFPPFCCILGRAAFWPPKCAYFFYIPPPGDSLIDVRNRDDAVKMRMRKDKLTKFKTARKCDPAQKYSVGILHHCANDVEEAEGFIVVTSRKKYVACVYIKCPTGDKPRFTMLYSHPNGSDISDHLIGMPSLIDMARFYRCDVYTYDYTGYGMSRGSSSERNMYADISAVYNHIIEVRNVPASKIVMMGYSIGTAATVELVKTQSVNVPAGIILLAPPASIFRVLVNVIGLKRVGETTCCLDKFSTVNKIADIKVPVLIIHGEKDRTVPIAHGKLICEKAVTKVTPEWVATGTHNDLENCKQVWLRIRKELGMKDNENEKVKND
ncbi:unnamed protein product [Caenorhabditis bovis]|uniref:NAD/GMP synthase domain-containing protein n=1 Tax=Caenorhabditis bovis TaxID=2654633 RepID=A0A8S1F1B1_9PELO|nr:unnamed protein product [Caenorhabditis bovis]